MAQTPQELIAAYLAGMKHQPAMYALERLHAELGGQILQNKQEARRLAKCMKSRRS
jgi:hypothetical protein